MLSIHVVNTCWYAAIVPAFRRDEVLAMIPELPDLSVSRPRAKLQCGIAVPGDDSQTVRRGRVSANGGGRGREGKSLGE